jgi:hypothetical protein
MVWQKSIDALSWRWAAYSAAPRDCSKKFLKSSSTADHGSVFTLFTIWRLLLGEVLAAGVVVIGRLQAPSGTVLDYLMIQQSAGCEAL